MQIKLGTLQNMLGVACVGCVEHRKLDITSVCRDTSDVRPGALFVCIEGSRFDGHDFAQEAVNRGAVALLADRYLEYIDVPQLLVPTSMGSTVEVLGKFAHVWREEFAQNGGRVVGITGSSGKTTVKEVLADLLQNIGKKVARNILNYNNQIGMPLSVLATSGQEDFWVMELGISKPGDMEELGAILEPDVAVVLNVGCAHTEGLGEQGVAWHKTRLLEHLTRNGQGFVSADYADLLKEAKAVFPKVRTFSAQEEFNSMVTARYIGRVSAENESGKFSIRIKMDASGGMHRFEVSAPFLGDYGAENVAAVVSAALSLGVKVDEIQRGFHDITLPKQRFELKKAGEWNIIDDSYNANPLSMQRMLNAALSMAEETESKACYAVLGSMGELGTSAEHEHRQLGKFLATSGVSHIFWKGDFSEHVHKGLKCKKYAGEFNIVHDEQDFAEKWNNMHLTAGTVLCKGSRNNALETFVPIMLDYAQTHENSTRGSNVL